MKIQRPNKKIGFDPEKTSKLLGDLIEVFQKYKPTVGEIITVSSNLLYALGASIGGYEQKGPGIDELKRLYYSEPGKLDVALMLQGLTMATWYEDWEKLQIKEDTKEQQNNESHATRHI